MVELDGGEIWDLLEMMISTRYPGFDAVEFMMAFEDGTTEDIFPGSHDLMILADSLGDW